MPERARTTVPGLGRAGGEVAPPAVNVASLRCAMPANCPEGYFFRYSLKSSGSVLFLIESQNARSIASGSTRAGAGDEGSLVFGLTATAGGEVGFGRAKTKSPLSRLGLRSLPYCGCWVFLE